MGKSEISIIIPAYNKENSILDTLDSVFNQTLRDFEVIVIDDGSTDNTKSVIQSYKESIRYFYQDNKGQGAARNFGISKSNGKYIVFLDADDYWEKDFLKVCYDYLEKHSDLIAVNTAQKTILENGSFFYNPVELIKNGFQVLDDFFKTWALHDHVRTGTAMIRKTSIDAIGYQNPDLRISQDLEYWGLIATTGKWGFIPDCLWVGNSRVHAKKTGWSKKYKKRRRLCPDVEEWEKRLDRLVNKEQYPYYLIVKGRVAIGYTHNKILGGNSKDAKHIIKKYGHLFPENLMAKLLKRGLKYGSIPWGLTILIIKTKEYLKDII